MAKVKAPKIDINTDILRIGGSLYAVKRIQAKEVDINAELRELYGKRFSAHVEQINEGCVSETIKDWDSQIQHLRKYEGKNAKAIPQALFGKPVMIWNNNLLELRAVIYAPHEVIGTFEDRRFNNVRAKIREAITGVQPADTICVSIKSNFAVPIWYGYNERSGTLHTPNFKTYHTMGSGNVCTGNHTGRDFWRLDPVAFAHEVNKVNLFSPATASVLVGGREYDIGSLCTRDNFVSARKRGDDTWNV